MFLSNGEEALVLCRRHAVRDKVHIPIVDFALPDLKGEPRKELRDLPAL